MLWCKGASPAAARYFTSQLCAVLRRYAREKRTQKIGKEHAAAHPELDEGQAKKASL
jgi:hypothetical protein